MSDKQKWPIEKAKDVALNLVMALMPVCENVHIAGSIRRKKPFVSDIELLMLPKFEARTDPDNMFEVVPVSMADEMIAQLEYDGVIERRRNVSGSTNYGPKNKLMRHVASGINVDLFATTKENFFMSLVIRTGPKEFNLRLIKSAGERGLKVHAYGVFEDRGTGEKIIPKSEAEVLSMAGIPWIDPKDR